MSLSFDEKEFLSCCGSTRFAKDMASACPFDSLEEAVTVARDVWFNSVDVNGWLQALSAHPQIGETSSQWCMEEQSTALATATASSLQEIAEWNARYRQKFGFIFLIFASGRSADEILSELKRRYSNRPIAEFEIASQEEMKIAELRLAKLFSSKENIPSTPDKDCTSVSKKAEEDRESIIGGHVTVASESPTAKSIQNPPITRPPITTHVLDVARGSPAAAIEVLLEAWKGSQSCPAFGEAHGGSWVFQGYSTTDSDGQSGQLMSIVDSVTPGIYRISFNTGKYMFLLCLKSRSHIRGNISMSLCFFHHFHSVLTDSGS